MVLVVEISWRVTWMEIGLSTDGRRIVVVIASRQIKLFRGLLS